MVPLRPDAPFHTIALPSEHSGTPAPWRSHGPHQGRLYLPDAEVITEVLARFTATPQECFFCLWDGYGFGGVPLTLVGTPPATPLPDPIPDAVRRGSHVKLPHREYLLYTGSVQALTAPASLGQRQTANLAWPADHTWCLASEIDLTSTYIGGPAALINALCADGRIEALPAGPEDPIGGVEPFVTALAEQAADELVDSGFARIVTSRGQIEAHLERPTRLHQGALRVRIEGDNGTTGGSGRPIRYRDDLRKAAVFCLTHAVVALVEED